ncbi:hypothetical protein K7X08_011716 [Anisodus acutangulus]|uniref:Uncharacterized protein n=1 Tax=Anisodus acutangulus TaxID=402998 RepID=A0A9Q1MK32_9SOLA|nr:hypothetical protein K7X08_011716 [Anisodus acutangulus]
MLSEFLHPLTSWGLRLRNLQRLLLSREQENQSGEDEENHGENAQSQLVLYDHVVTAATSTAKLLELLVRIFTYKRLKNCTSSTVVTVNPISWVAPVGNTGLLGGAVPSAPSDAASLDVPDGNSPQKSKLKGQSDAVIVED